MLFFGADDGIHGQGLWISDGTADGTKMVQDIADGSESSDPINITALGDKILFTAKTPETGYELFVLTWE